MWLLFFLFFLIPYPIFATDYSANNSTTITASINENRVTIFGYTSPNSRVELSNIKIFAVTYSDQDGYFLFDKTLIPKSTADLCLISTDNNFRQTTPTCFPAPPLTNYQTDIGPVLLPPTISLENSNINPNTTVITSGQSIPKSKVAINFYKINNTGKTFSTLNYLGSLIKPKPALAYSLPSVTATTDEFGNFSLTLPTAYSSDYRLYGSTKFNENYSPKSNTLIYILPSLFYLFLQQYPFIKYLLPLFIFTLIIFFYFLHFKSTHRLLTKKYLPAIRRVSPAITICKIKKK